MRPENMCPKVIYEDNHIIIVEKPQGMLSQSDKTGDPDMLTIVKSYVKDKYDKPGNVYIGLLHRLDRPVGGVMAFARTSKSASRISRQIREGEFNKTYLAVVNGIVALGEGFIKSLIKKDTKLNRSAVVAADGSDDASDSGMKQKEARMEYEVLERDADRRLTLLRLKLLTGRSHQIRVQLSSIGHPVLGDVKYAGKYCTDKRKTVKSVALWAHTIMLTHPVLKNRMEFTSAPPDVFPWNLFEGVCI